MIWIFMESEEDEIKSKQASKKNTTLSKWHFWSLKKREKKLETNLVEAWLENHQFSAVGANNHPIVQNNGIKQSIK